MSAEERLKLLQDEFKEKLDAVLEAIEANHMPGTLDAGNPEINKLWTWYREEAAKIRNEHQ